MRVASDERTRLFHGMGVAPIFCMCGKESESVERAMTNKERELEMLLAPTVKALGCEIWGVEYRPRGRGRSALKLYIDSADGVTIDDCERVSRQVSALLDVEDPIVDRYRLEVSSPGLDRVLFRREQYLANVGQCVDVRLAFPFEGRRHVEGQLAGVEGPDVIVRPLAGSEPLACDKSGEGDGDKSREGDECIEYVLPLAQIQRTRIVPDFNAGEAAESRAAGQRR